MPSLVACIKAEKKAEIPRLDLVRGFEIAMATRKTDEWHLTNAERAAIVADMEGRASIPILKHAKPVTG